MSEKVNVAEIFGANVFNDAVMRERLPKSVYKKLRKTIVEGTELEPGIADSVAQAMKEWAIERGASRSPELPQKSMIPLSRHRILRGKLCWNFPEKN